MSQRRMKDYRLLLQLCSHSFGTSQKKTSFAANDLLRIGTKSLFFIMAILLSSGVSAQRAYDWRTQVDMLVERADSLSLKSQRSFYLDRIVKVDKTFKNDRTVKETWYYTISEGKIPIFQIRYLLDSTEYNETYYLDNGKLVCYEQDEIDFFSKYDEMEWGKVLFFDNNSLKLHVSIGQHKLQGQPESTPFDVIETFNKRYTELLRNLRLNGVKDYKTSLNF